MKIGAFAKHFNLNKTTIRYYTDISLLLPDTTATYPDYNTSSLRDMEKIIQYKSMGFSIEEIKEITVLERFYVNLSESNMSHIHDLMDKKISHHYKMIEDHKVQINKIEELKESIGSSNFEESKGLDLMTLSFLECPYCSKSFSVENATIKENSIHEGSLKCECGSNFNINSGIIYPNGYKSNHTGRDKQVESIEFSNKLNNNHISVIKHTGSLLNKKLELMDHSKGIIFANADIDILMMNLDQSFQSNGIYFMCSYDITGLIILKSKMERQALKGHFTFIALNSDLPLIGDIPYLIDNVGNLYDCVMKEDIGFGIKYFNKQALYAKEWYLIQMYTPDNSMSKVEEIYKPYLLKDNYRTCYNSMALNLISQDEAGEFKYIEGMIGGITGIGSMKVELLTYSKDKKNKA